jgi:hypothetical protein
MVSRLVINRRAPEIQQLLRDEFKRLSKNSRLSPAALRFAVTVLPCDMSVLSLETSKVLMTTQKPQQRRNIAYHRLVRKHSTK